MRLPKAPIKHNPHFITQACRVPSLSPIQVPVYTLLKPLASYNAPQQHSKIDNTGLSHVLHGIQNI